MDYAIYLSGPENECIIYIKDTQEQMLRVTWEIFAIIIYALLIGLIIAVMLSFFLAKAITSPIQRITKVASGLAEGDFKEKIKVASSDEIGTLTETFNDMAEKLESTIDEVSSEREKLEIIFLYLKDGVLVFSSGGALILMNPEAGGILKGFGYNNNLGDFLELLNLHEHESSRSEGKSADIFRDISCGERIFDINIGSFKYMDGHREAMGTIAVMQDITQRYSLEKSRREFIANVSHELRTPLTTIRSAAESMENEKIKAEIKLNFLSMILSESDRMARIVEDLLVVSRFDNKKMMWKFAPVDLKIMAGNIYEAMRGEAEKKGQSFRLDINGDVPLVYADKERIAQVLVNIISNAVKYTQPGGSIELALAPHEIKDIFAGVKFIVKDNGYGIPKEDLPHIFERFYRVDKARSAGGTGLGLSIAQEIVAAHKGTIKLDSAIGEGTTVTITLPQGDGHAEAEIYAE
jgi:two-component system sensor histidine kinase VicK